MAKLVLSAVALYLLWQAVAWSVGLFAEPTPRKILVELSHLPIPKVIYDAKTVNRNALDADVWAVARLAPGDCRRTSNEAQSRGFKPVPWPEHYYSVTLGEGVPLPARGWYWAEDTRFRDPNPSPPPGKRHAQLAWIDAETCRVFASYNSGG